MSVSPENGGPVTQKDVYAAVDNVRVELGGKIDKLAETVQTVVTSHEHRLTIVEQMQAVHAEQIAAAAVGRKEHSDEISTIKDQLREDEAAANALADAKEKRSSTRRWVIATVLSVLGVIATVAYILVALG